jgi:hypothetical protein
MNLNFEIENGLLGVGSYAFLSLLGYTNFDHDDKKTRNV